MNPERVGFILGGGGFKGVAHIGWLETLIPALLKKEAQIVYLGGVSVGSLIAGKLAEAQYQEELLIKLKEIKEIFCNVEKHGDESVFPLSGLNQLRIIGKTSILDGSTLWDLLNNPKLTSQPFNPGLVVSSPIRFEAFVRNVARAGHEAISNRNAWVKKRPQIISSAIVASSSITPFFPKVKIGNIIYSDGGHIQLDGAIRAGCDTIFVLLPYFEDGLDSRPKDWLSKILPIIYEVLEAYSTEVHDRNRAEIALALRLADIIRNKRETFKDLQEEARSLVWRLSKKKRIDELFSKVKSLVESNRDLNIFPVYMRNKPNSLSLHTFEKGDISKLSDSCAKQMEKIAKEIGLLT